MGKSDDEEDIMTSRKITVKTSSCPSEVQSLVADFCIQVKSIKNYMENCTALKGMLDKKFKGEWNVIVGREFTGCCSIDPKSLLELKVGEVHFLIFRSFPVKKT